jgi:surface antigen
MNRAIKNIVAIIFILGSVYGGYYYYNHNINPNPKYAYGQKLDSLNGVFVFYNGNVGHADGRNTAEDGYNIGLKYQCVEFVKRYYYEYYHHKMPDAFGNAKDFFDINLSDSNVNVNRDLLQFTNPSKTKPQIGDLIIFDGHVKNKYGHVAIISTVDENNIEIIQQNPGPFSSSRDKIGLNFSDSLYHLKHERILGWLRMK